MNVYFGASTSQFEEFGMYYCAIRDEIVAQGHVLTRDWLGEYREFLLNPNNNTLPKTEPSKRYPLVLKALQKADALIVEDTVSSFSNGHLMTLALQRNMPVLVLHLEGEKKQRFNTTFLDGLENENLEVATYSQSTIEPVITHFFAKFEEHYKRHRFHLVIDEVEKRYLDWAQQEYDTSKTSIIRRNIRARLENDTRYKKYLGGSLEDF